jgi:putative SOS response-associated peptidase YedK
MCGRYRLSRRKQVLAEHFDAVPFEDDWEPRYNIAPTQPVPVIRQHRNFRKLSLLRWVDTTRQPTFAGSTLLCTHLVECPLPSFANAGMTRVKRISCAF